MGAIMARDDAAGASPRRKSAFILFSALGLVLAGGAILFAGLRLILGAGGVGTDSGATDGTIAVLLFFGLPGLGLVLVGFRLLLGRSGDNDLELDL